MNDFPSDAERREEICSTRFPADAWQQGNECLPVPACPRWNGSSSPCSEAALPGTAGHGMTAQPGIRNGLLCARRAREHSFTTCAVAVAVTRDCRHHFCSVSKTAVLSCCQVLKEEECKTH